MSEIGRKINSYLIRLKNKEKCFDEFFDFSFGYIAGIAFKYLTDKSHVDDVISSTFKSVYFNLGKFDADKNGSAWMYEIAKNEALKINQRISAKYVCVEYPEIPKDFDNVLTDILEEYDLQVAINELNDYERHLIDLRIYEEMDIRTIAKILNKKPWTVRRELKKIYKELENILNDK